MKRFLVVMSVLAICFSVVIENAYAVHFTGRAPQYTGGGDPATPGTLNNELATAFQTAMDDANLQVAKFKNQDKMAQAFGDASAYSSHASELWGYQGYDNIAILGGLALGVQAPSLDANTLSSAVKDIEQNGDAEVGASLAGGINLGLHLGWFSSKAKDWYVNVKFFMYDLAIPYAGYTFNFETMTMGVGLNYQLVQTKKFGKGMFLWRGVSIGTGFLVQNSSLNYKIGIDTQSGDLGGAFSGMSVLVDPSINLGLKMTTYTIPIDLVSSLRILYFLNINVGAGIDFNFGTSEVVAKADGDVNVSGYPGGYGQIVPGRVKGDASTQGEPFVIRGRLMAGVGITIAPVVLLDVTATYYLTTGVGLNLSAGFVW